MSIIQKAEQFVFVLFKDKLSSSYTYHNFNHTQRVVRAAEKLIASEKLSADDETAVLLAAWFHDTGYVKGSDGHEEKSLEYLKEFLAENPISESIQSLTESLILMTQFSREPKTKLEYIIRDADCSHFSDPNYEALSELLREEWKLTLNKTYTDLEWINSNRDMLLTQHRYFTDFAKNEWQEQKDANITVLQEKSQSLNAEEKKKKQKKAEKDDKRERGVETMFKVTLNNHTRLSQIADSKANILLSVSAIIISISLSTLIPKLDRIGNGHLMIPTFILIFFNVATIIFAILSTKPKVTTGSFTRDEIVAQKVNLLFFGNFYKMPIEEYQWAMNEMMKDPDYLYNSLIKDLYYLGVVLNRKYTLLRITYMVFMIGIIISVGAFVLAFRSVHV